MKEPRDSEYHVWPLPGHDTRNCQAVAECPSQKFSQAQLLRHEQQMTVTLQQQQQQLEAPTMNLNIPEIWSFDSSTNPVSVLFLQLNDNHPTTSRQMGLAGVQRRITNYIHTCDIQKNKSCQNTSVHCIDTGSCITLFLRLSGSFEQERAYMKCVPNVTRTQKNMFQKTTRLDNQCSTVFCPREVQCTFQHYKTYSGDSYHQAPCN